MNGSGGKKNRRNMPGSVRKKGNRWYYSFEIQKKDGKRQRIERAGGDTESQAWDALNDALYKYSHGHIMAKKITYGELMKDFLEFVEKNRKINTYVRYKELYEIHIKPFLADIHLKDMTPFHIEKMLQSIKEKQIISNTTLQGIFGVVSVSLNKAMKWQYIDNNICRFIEKPRRYKYMANTLTIDEFNLILNKLDKGNYKDYLFHIAMLVSMELGLRRGELAGLEWRNIDFEKNTIQVENNLICVGSEVLLGTPKTLESKRKLYVSDELLSLLKNHKRIQNENKLRHGKYYEKNYFNGKECDFIFALENGQHINPTFFSFKFNALRRSLGIKKVRFHDIRHTNATLLLRAGVDFKIISERLGHSNIHTTLNIYSHVTTDMQKAATEKISSLLTYSSKKIQ